MHGNKFMTKHFIKLYLLLLLTVAGTAWTVDTIYLNFQQSKNLDVENQQKSNYRPLLEHYTAQLAINAQNDGYLLPKNVAYVSKQALAWPPALLTKLNQGEVVVLTDSMNQISYYLSSKASDNVVMLTIVDHEAISEQSTTIWLFLFYGAIGVVVWLWVYPLVKDIYRLQSAAICLGQGKQYGTIDLSKNSMLSPTGDAFNEMSARIGNLLGLQQDTNSAVSHDIRTPLSRIKFTLAGCDERNLKQCKDSIVEDINEIDDLVNEILLYSKIEHANPLLDIRKHNLMSIISQTVNKYQLMTNVEFHLVGDSAMEAFFDQRSFNRVLQNLIDNSIRFAQNHIHIEVKVVDKQNVLIIEDDGPGIPEIMLNKITQPYIGTSEVERSSEGFGLGLFIVKKICIWHNGTFNVDNTSEYGGAKFKVMWPLKKNDNIE